MKAIPIIICALAIVVCLLPFALERGKLSQQYIETGNAYLEDLRFRDAIGEFRTAKAISSSSAEANLGIAKAYLTSGEDDFAFELLFGLSEDERNYESRKILLDLAKGSGNLSCQLKMAEEMLVYFDGEDEETKELEKIYKELFQKRTQKSRRADFGGDGYAYVITREKPKAKDESEASLETIVTLSHKKLSKGKEIDLSFPEGEIAKSVILRNDGVYIITECGKAYFYDGKLKEIPCPKGEKIETIAYGSMGECVLTREGSLFIDGVEVADRVVDVKQGPEGIAYLKSNGELYLKAQGERETLVLDRETEYFDIGHRRLVFGNSLCLKELKKGVIADVPKVYDEVRELSNGKCICDVLAFDGYTFAVLEGENGALVGDEGSAYFKNDDQTDAIFRSGELILATKADQTLSAYTPSSIFNKEDMVELPEELRAKSMEKAEEKSEEEKAKSDGEKAPLPPDKP